MKVFSAWREGMQVRDRKPEEVLDGFHAGKGKVPPRPSEDEQRCKTEFPTPQCNHSTASNKSWSHKEDLDEESESNSEEEGSSSTTHKVESEKPSLRRLKKLALIAKIKRRLEPQQHYRPLWKPTKLSRNEKDQKEYKTFRVFGARKYKPVGVKVRPVKTTLPDEFRVKREILGEPLKDMPELSRHPPKFVPSERYTQERKEVIDANHDEGFLWEQEMDLVHHLMSVQEQGFAWSSAEAGTFREDFFPPVKFPVLPHEPWVERNIPIPPGIFEEVCKVIKTKIDAGVYEPSSSSYRSKWFCVVKKDGKSLRLVHSLEALNKVTIQYSGIPPATADVARDFAGRACVGTLDLYVGYDERPLDVSSRDFTTFQTPYGPHRLVKLPMGWTNSVPIYHDDVTYILQDEVPHVTRPYVDDVPIKGPATRYELPDGGYETIPENPGIRRFVWEHMQNVNRVVQRMKYAGGTFSGTKAFICVAEGMVVGHKCTYEGRKPEDKIADVVLSWPECKDKSDVRAFLGTAS